MALAATPMLILSLLLTVTLTLTPAPATSEGSMHDAVPASEASTTSFCSADAVPAASEASTASFYSADAVPAASDVCTASFYSADLHYELVVMARLVAQRATAKISSERMLATADVIHVTTMDVEEDDCAAYDVVKTKVLVLAQCASNRTAADCVRCLQDSAQAVAWDLDAARGDGGVAATVEGCDCNIRFEVSSALVPRSDPSDPSDTVILSRKALISSRRQQWAACSLPFFFLFQNMGYNKFCFPTVHLLALVAMQIATLILTVANLILRVVN